MSNPANRTLLGVGYFSAAIVAVFMSQTLYGLMSANKFSFLGLLMGLGLEAFRVAACYTAAFDYWPNRRYGALACSAAMVAAITMFSVWAGNERLIHSVAADEKHLQAQRVTRSEQIKEEIQAIDLQLADLSKPYLVTADTKHERDMLKGLQAQASAMRDRMALTKASEMESGVIADLLAIISRKEEAADSRNQKETERRQVLERELRDSKSRLNHELVEIASLASKIESSDRTTTEVYLKIVALVFEAIPLFVFFFCEKPSHAMAKARKAGAVVVQAKEGAEPVVKPIPEPVPAIAAAVVEDLPTPALDQVSDDAPAAAVEASADEVADTPAVIPTQAATPAYSHPKLDQVLSSVMGMSSGEPVTTEWLKATFEVGGSSATYITKALHAAGLIVKPGKSWIRA